MKRIFVISLAKSQDRKQAIIQEMQDKGLEFEFFDAIDGRKSFPWHANDYDYIKRLWLTSGKMPSNGEIGCYASHYLLWLKCIELNQAIIICEDDIKLHDNIRELINYALTKIDKYDFIRLEPVAKNGEDIYLIETEKQFKISLMKNNFGGLRMYAISPRAAVKLIKHRWSFPVDCFIGANYIHGQYSYILEPSCCEHESFQTTIQDEVVAKAAVYRKLTRGIYKLYKKIMLEIMFRNKIRDYH